MFKKSEYICKALSIITSSMTACLQSCTAAEISYTDERGCATGCQPGLVQAPAPVHTDTHSEPTETPTGSLPLTWNSAFDISDIGVLWALKQFVAATWDAGSKLQLSASHVASGVFTYELLHNEAWIEKQFGRVSFHMFFFYLLTWLLLYIMLNI